MEAALAVQALVDLPTAINRFMKAHNATDAKSSRRTADPDRIIPARNRGYQALASRGT
jgi:hypothetical protein